MFKQLLVPLDGSHLAEAALPAAVYLAQTLDIPVTLIHIIEHNPPEAVHGERHLTNPDQALTYLDEVARRAFSSGVQVELHVHTSEVRDVARCIVDHAGEMESDLVVMCAHGRGGLRNWLFGSIAQQVIALGTASVLVVQPTETGMAPAFACQRLLSALDGNPDHEQGLPVAAALARACAASLHLVMVVHTPGTLSGAQAATARLLPGATAELLDQAERSAEEYLNQHMARFQTTGLPVTVEVRRGDPAETIVHTARKMKADLIVLGTHGKTGMDAFWSGSITPKVSSQSRLPLLLVRVHETEVNKSQARD